MKLTGLTSRRLKIISVVLVVASVLFGGDNRSSKASNEWLTDFEAAKALAVKEGKLILVCSCISGGNSWVWGSWRNYNDIPTDTVLPRCISTKFWPGDVHFIRAARRKYVLLRVNLADGLDAEDYSKFRLNHPKINNDDSKWWGCGDIRIVDATGSFVKKVAKLDDVLSKDVLEKTSGQVRKQDKKNKNTKRGGTQPQIARVQGTRYTTPDGWMDNFRYAQDIALQEGKDLFIVFTSHVIPCRVKNKSLDEHREHCYEILMHGGGYNGELEEWRDLSYKTVILTSPLVINTLQKEFVLVFLSSEHCLEKPVEKENEQILKELLKRADMESRHRGLGGPITMLMTNDGKQISVIMDSWGEVKSLIQSMPKLKRRYAEQQLAEKFINFINDKRPKDKGRLNNHLPVAP